MALRDVWPQFFAALLCNVGVLTFGLQGGWLAPLQPLFQSDHSPLGGSPLTDEEISWFGALPSVTLTFSAPFFGWIMTKYGRRTTLWIATAPNVVTYLLLILANNVPMVCASRVLGGFCSCGSFIVGPIYVNELVEARLKGPLGSLTGFFIKLGIIMSFILGAYTSYLTLNIISLSFTVMFLIAFPWLPESPAYLITTGKVKEAEAALSKLWKGQGKEMIRETIKRIQGTNPDSENTLSFKQLIAQFTSDKKLRNAMIIVSGMYGFQMLTGYPAIVRYAVDVVQDAGSEFSSYNVAICLATVQLIFAATGSILLEKLGRKTLVVFNLFMMALCMGTLSIYIFLSRDHERFPFVQKLTYLPTIVLISFFAFYALGYGTVPFVIIPELFVPEARPIASTLLNMWFALVEFIVVKMFPTVSAIISLHGSIALFSIFSFIGTAFLYWKMFETKGLSFDQVQRKLEKRTSLPSLSDESMQVKNQPLLPTPKTRPHC